MADEPNPKDPAEDPNQPDPDAPEGDDPDPEGSEDLGDKGKQALDRMKEQRNAARAEAREFKSLGLSAADIKKILDTRKDSEGDKPDPDAIRREAETAAQTKASERILRSEVKAAAAGKLADPADAYKFLDLSKFEVDDDGNVDEDEVAEAIADLIKNKPYLAVQDGKRFKGSADGGTRKESRPGQLTRDDLKRMSPKDIEKARREGRLNDVLGIK